MPEGPSIVLLKEEIRPFVGQRVISVEGNSKTDIDRMAGQTLISAQSWGKQFLLCFEEFTLRIHFLLFGSYRINERKDQPIRLNLTFPGGEINFYSCSVKILEGDVNAYYDWSADVMNDRWDAQKAKEKLEQVPHKLICDALLEQDIFAGVGNIIKNEVLYRVFVHPESLVGKLPPEKTEEIIEQARVYSFEFLAWKRDFVLKKQWLAHTKQLCLRCNLPIIKKYTGTKKRRSFFCTGCQQLYL